MKLYALLRHSEAKQYNVSLTEDEARLQQQRQQYVTTTAARAISSSCSCWASSEDTFDSISRMAPAVCDLYTAEQQRRRAPHAGGHRRLRSGKRGLRNEVKLLYWPPSGGKGTQAQAEDFAARPSHRRG